MHQNATQQASQVETKLAEMQKLLSSTLKSFEIGQSQLFQDMSTSKTKIAETNEAIQKQLQLLFDLKDRSDRQDYALSVTNFNLKEVREEQIKLKMSAMPAS